MPEPKQFTYQIDGKTYIQKELVWEQWLQILPHIEALSFPGSVAATVRMLSAEGKLYPLMAIILTEEGQSLESKNLDETAAAFKFNTPLRIILEVANHFFDFNDIVFLLEESMKLGLLLKEIATDTHQKIGLMKPSASSPKATSPNETPSSGDTPPGSANPTSSIAVEV